VETMYQECLYINFHIKHYLTNLPVNENWDDHQQGGTINFNRAMGHNGDRMFKVGKSFIL
jgi:hypothetical protein